MVAMAKKSGCLRREYLEKEEGWSSTPVQAAAPQDKSAFSFYGHRLSSLYRALRLTRAWLTRTYLPSSFPKYSNSEAFTRSRHDH